MALSRVILPLRQLSISPQVVRPQIPAVPAPAVSDRGSPLWAAGSRLIRTARKGRGGFSLLELITVLLAIAILSITVVGSVASIRSRAEKARCTNNLTNLFVATNAYVQDRESWPQVDPKTLRSPAYARLWIAALKPYQMSEINWVCPSIQRTLDNPDLTDPKNSRVDYLATPFDSHPRSPFRWPTQPWFIERGDMHGDGNLVLFANGQIKSLGMIRRDTASQVIE